MWLPTYIDRMSSGRPSEHWCRIGIDTNCNDISSFGLRSLDGKNKKQKKKRQIKKKYINAYVMDVMAVEKVYQPV